MGSVDQIPKTSTPSGVPGGVAGGLLGNPLTSRTRLKVGKLKILLGSQQMLAARLVLDSQLVGQLDHGVDAL